MMGASRFKQLIITGLIAVNCILITCINNGFICKHPKYEEMFTLCSVLTDHMMTSCVILMQNETNSKETSSDEHFPKRKHFVVTTVPILFWQYTDPEGNGTSTYAGVTIDILSILSKNLNFDYELKEVSDGQWGKVDENGTWSGLIGQIVRNEADIAAADITITKERFDAVDFTTPFAGDSRAFVTKKPIEHKIMIYLNVFQKELWFLIASTVIFSGLIIKYFETSADSCQDNAPQHHGFFEQKLDRFLTMFGFMINQGCHRLPKRKMSRAFLCCYWVVTISITALYMGNLVAFMAIPNLEQPVNSLEKLAAHPDYQAGIVRGSTQHTLFNRNDSGMYKTIWDNNINVNPENIYTTNKNSTLNAFHRIRREKFVRIGSETYEEVFRLKEGFCDLQLSKTKFFKSSLAFAVSKRFPCLEMFNRKMTRMVESGIVEKIMRKHWPRNSCQNFPSSIEKEKTRVQDTTGAFITLLVGLSTSFLTLIVEIICGAAKKRKTAKNFVPSDAKVSVSER